MQDTCSLFEDTDGDGIANVPEYYAVTHNRKVVDDSTNIIDLVKNPNRFSVMIVLDLPALPCNYYSYCSPDPKTGPQGKKRKVCDTITEMGE